MSKNLILRAFLLAFIAAIIIPHNACAVFNPDDIAEEVGKLYGQARILKALQAVQLDSMEPDAQSIFGQIVQEAWNSTFKTFQAFGSLLRQETMLEGNEHGGFKLKQEAIAAKSKEYEGQVAKLDRVKAMFSGVSAELEALVFEVQDVCVEMGNYWQRSNDIISRGSNSYLYPFSRSFGFVLRIELLLPRNGFPMPLPKGAHETLHEGYVGIFVPEEFGPFQKLHGRMVFAAQTLRAARNPVSLRESLITPNLIEDIDDDGIDVAAEKLERTKLRDFDSLMASFPESKLLKPVVPETTFNPAHVAFSRMSPLARDIYFATRDPGMDENAAFNYVCNTSLVHYKNLGESQYKRAQEAVKVAGQYMSELEKFARELLAMQHAQYDQERISRAPNMTSSESESGSGKKEAALYATETVAGHKKIETDMQAKLEALQALMKDFTSRK